MATKAKALAAGLVFAAAGALALIGRNETPAGKTDNFRVYADALAGGLPTSECNGITPHITATPMRVGDVWSAAKCRTETARAVDKVQGELIACFATVPPQSVFDAATSFAWNYGVPTACASAAMAAWNRGDWNGGCRKLLVGDDGKVHWVYTGGSTFTRGLLNRRADEMAACWVAP